ncbi:MAG: methyl-accepting chemotaxis protein [Desulfovibrio sp.]|uniref:methyl-accepting chemotaxis protein n=1 Tax=Desulfovibrio sp. 7SRBS1 TaxID=3378064 RepID=UPI003B412012
MRASIMVKVMGMVSGIVIFTCLSVYLTANHYMSRGFAQSEEGNINTMKSVVAKEIQDLMEKYEGEAKIFGRDYDLEKAVAEGDIPALKRQVQSLMTEAHMDFITITDARGKVLMRGHSDQTGDNAAGHEGVAAALKGKAYVGVVTGTVVPFSLRASAPIYSQDNIVGTISLGKSLVSTEFVDSIKEHTHLDVTVFKGDTRAMTTIVKNGKRAIGTKMSNPEVVETVLLKGKAFLARNNILGRDYQTAYWPIRTHGKIVGMWFIGAPLTVIEQTQDAVSNATMVAAVIITLLMLCVGFILAKTLSTPIHKTTIFASAVAEGNLDMELNVKTTDETNTLAGALRTMVASLKSKIQEAENNSRRAAEETEKAHEAMKLAEEARKEAEHAKREGMLLAAEQLQDIVEIISSASENLSTQIETSANGADVQCQRTAETATAMEEMNATVLEVAQSASAAASTSNDATSRANEGAEIVDGVITEIDHVHTLSGELEQGMDRLGQRADAIGNIMNVIADIADQTNLLALNAAIEAARAGDAGRGFAVVADEVRKLAEKTMHATKEVGEAINGIQADTHTNVTQVADTVKVIDVSREKAKQAGEALSEIVELTQNASGQVLSIATASEEQSAASEEINEAVADINRISEETNIAMNESSKAVMELTNQAQQLKKLIDQMREENS